MSLNDITIIIVSYKSTKKVKKCIDSIAGKSKIIVIENSNDFSHKENIEKEYSNVECIIANDNLGYGKANNLGLKQVRTKYALILNPDTRIESDTLEKFLEAANKIKNFAIIGPQQNEDYKEKKYIQETYEVENLKGYALFLNMIKFKDTNFFDENFFLYFEEIDLCRNLRNKKEKIYISPQIKIFHDGAQSVDDSLNYEVELTRNWHWMWSTFYYYKKHYNYLYALTVVSPKLFSALFKIILFVILFNKKRRQIYYQRLSGLINSILGKKSWYRPTLD
jgi:GT2 family glycosyltransferase|tara:strand:- start:51 stop:887 length:837 start_codon:yes stop_codon:yes gene_type:complete